MNGARSGETPDAPVPADGATGLAGREWEVCARVAAAAGLDAEAWAAGARDQTTLDALGLDSLRVAELGAALEEELGVRLGPGVIAPDVTLAELSALVAEGGAARAMPSSVPGDTLSAMLAAAAGGRGRCTWIHEEGPATVQTFAALEDEARRIAAGLVGHGIGRGDRVAIVADAASETVPVFFGIVRCGAVAVPLAPPRSRRALPQWTGQVARRLARVRCRWLVCGGAPAVDVPGVRTLAGEALRKAVPTGAAADQPDALALLQFSSGTGGEAKPVALTHRNLRANTRAASLRGRMSADDAFVSWLPLYHDMGLIGGVLTPIAIGASLTVIGPHHFLRRPAVWLRAIGDQRATVGLAPSFGYAYAARRIADADCAGLDLGSWRLAWNGAEPVRASVIAAFDARFARYGWRPEAMMPTYGLAEASLCVTCPEPGTTVVGERLEPAALRAGRAVVTDDPQGVVVVGVGAALPGFDVRIAGEAGPVPDGRVAEIQVRGPSVMRGYDGDAEATAAAFVDGWLRTGDLGYLHDGQLFVCGRTKDTVVLRGMSLLAVELEAAVDAVAETRTGRVLVFDEPGADGDQVLVVVAEVRAGASRRRARDAIRASLHARFGVVPGRIVLVPPRALPVTTSGKLCRYEVRARYGRGGPGAGWRETMAGWAERVQRVLGRVRRCATSGSAVR